MKRMLGLVALVATVALNATPAARQDLGVPSKNGVVVCTSAPACDAGAALLAKGGNAVDAAVATAFALAVTHPAAGNIGGGGFMIVRTPDGQLTSFDYREQAPLKATPTMYLGKDGEIDRSLTAAGYLAPGVPGSVRGLAMAHAKFGKLPWKDVVMPGVAARGAGLRDVGRARARPEPRSRRPDGPLPRFGRRLRQAWRRRVDGRRQAGPGRSRAHAARDRRPTVPTRSTRAGLPTRSRPT